MSTLEVAVALYITEGIRDWTHAQLVTSPVPQESKE